MFFYYSVWLSFHCVFLLQQVGVDKNDIPDISYVSEPHVISFYNPIQNIKTLSHVPFYSI